MTQLGNALKFREALGSDLNFIFDTFRESLRSDSSLGHHHRTGVFKREFSKCIDHILSKAKILIACDAENENTILGYLIWEPGIIYYVFVKEAWRLLGIAKALVEATGLISQEIVQCAFKTDFISHRHSKRCEERGCKRIGSIFEKYPFLIYNNFINFKQGAKNV